MSYVASICFGVCLYHTLLEYNILQQWVAPDLDWPTINLNSSGIFSISTFALSLLLVFRTNSSYERWWEARDCWRMIVNECTHLARQTEQWLPGAACEPLRCALLRWLRVFPISLMVHLRGHEEDLRGLVQGVLPPDESELLLASKNPPLLVLSAIGQLMAVSEMRIESKTHMDESVRVLQESLGSCEKILTTPIPISELQELGWLSVPISMVVSFLLFGIEEIGVQIEEPFGILALESYCDEVQAGISQATADATALLPITLKLTGGKVSDCLPNAAALQLPGYASGAAAVASGQLQHGLPLQQQQQAQQLVQAAAAGGASHRHSSQLHR
ncbi:Bestrophin, RFP-TM, chloride channel-domain-containing protein [Scenedesmus sp. NREL 46B-D3]|nr:Bestrophin, RFP-TM, chloride channel-domain-containing protein [Scenedesmus sp. NREL 46B-D3]